MPTEKEISAPIDGPMDDLVDQFDGEHQDESEMNRLEAKHDIRRVEELVRLAFGHVKSVDEKHVKRLPEEGGEQHRARHNLALEELKALFSRSNL